jgi:hypothetical protein
MLKREDLDPCSSSCVSGKQLSIVPPGFLANPQTSNLRHLFDGEPAERQLGPRGVRSTLVNDQGLLLTSYFWPADGEAKGVVLFVHGHGAYMLEEVLISKVRLAVFEACACFMNVIV